MIDSGSLPTNIRRAMLREPTIRPATVSPKPEIAESITFWVEGKPEPAGSKSSFVPTDKAGNPYRGPGGRIIVNTVDANKNSKVWKATVAREARMKFTRRPFEGPVECRFEFIVERPQCHFGTGKNAALVKDSAPKYPTSKPDTLKLSRGTEDALTSICWIDDAQVVSQIATKRYGETAGVKITVSPIAEADAPAVEQMEIVLPPAAKVVPLQIPESDDQTFL